jgi:hypothetical protein
MVFDNDAEKLTLLERSAEKEAVAERQQGGRGIRQQTSKPSLECVCFGDPLLGLFVCNVWGSVKTNCPSVNKYDNQTRHNSSLLDLARDIGCPLLGWSLSA